MLRKAFVVPALLTMLLALAAPVPAAAQTEDTEPPCKSTVGGTWTVFFPGPQHLDLCFEQGAEIAGDDAWIAGSVTRLDADGSIDESTSAEAQCRTPCADLTPGSAADGCGVRRPD